MPTDDHVLLIDIGDQASDPQDLRHALGDGAALLGTGPISPLSGKPEWTIYGRGPAAAQVDAVDIEPVDLDVLPEGFRQLPTV
jgi:hypothetical protein